MKVKTIMGTALTLAALSLVTTTTFAAKVKCYNVKEVKEGKNYTMVSSHKKCKKMGGSLKPVEKSTTTTTETTNSY